MYASATEVRRRAGSGRQPSRAARIALLGHGRIGSAVTRLIQRSASDLRPAAALVRRARPGTVPLVDDPADLFRSEPDAVVEVLGGTEPARTLILRALERGIPVVTANKSVVARHGDELFEAAHRAGVALRCEAAVVAGVPFLGALGARPFASGVDRFAGVLNGTGSFLLSRLEAGAAFDEALDEARARGLAEPDPSNDVDGTDAAEKLCVLARHAWRLSVHPDAVVRSTLASLTPDDLAAARELEGRLRPAAFARRAGDGIHAWTGPAFLHARDPLAQLEGSLNGVRLESADGAPVHFTGPGAGPDVTARTLLDDVHEVLRGAGPSASPDVAPARDAEPESSDWFVVLRGRHLPVPEHLADLLAAHGVWPSRWSARALHGVQARQAFLTWPCDAAAVHTALAAIASVSQSTFLALPVVEGSRG